MSVTDRIKEEERKKNSKGSTKKSTSSGGNFLTFNPTKEQREAIRNSELSLAENIDYIAMWLTEGHKISWSYAKEQQCYAVFLRQGDADWREALVISCWHADYEIAIRMLAYALNNVYTSFPIVTDRHDFRDVDW